MFTLIFCFLLFNSYDYFLCRQVPSDKNSVSSSYIFALLEVFPIPSALYSYYVARRYSIYPQSLFWGC